MVSIRPVLLSQCLALVLVCLLFTSGTHALPQFLKSWVNVLDAAPPGSESDSLGTLPGSSTDANDLDSVHAAVSSSSLSASATASAASSQASTNGASSVSVPAAFLFSAAASAVFLVF